jgi:hypothetical protein
MMADNIKMKVASGSEADRGYTVHVGLAPIRDVYDKLPVSVRQFLQLNPDIAIVGGFIRAIVAGEEPKDLDLAIVGDRITAYHAAQRLVSMAATWCHTTYLPNCVQIEIPGWDIPIQILERRRNSVVETLASFDFTICKTAMWFVGGYGKLGPDDTGLMWATHPDFLRDTEAKNLHYAPESALRRDTFAGTCLRRALKFAARGYHIDNTDLGQLILEIARTCLAPTDGDSEWVARFYDRMIEHGAGDSQ